jgi:hypothetical protein
MVAVAVVGVARLFDLVLRPDWSWLVLLVLAIGFAIWQLRRRQLTAASSTVWLDHHLGLGGLAMAELETDASAWRGELQERLRVAEPSRPLPRLRPGAVVVRVLGAAALIGGLWWLPAPSRAAARQQPLLAEALSRLEDQLDLFVEHSMLDAERQVEMQARLDRLREDLETGADVGWNDLDDLAATLDHERALAGESAEKTRAQAAQLARADAIAADVSSHSPRWRGFDRAAPTGSWRCRFCAHSPRWRGSSVAPRRPEAGEPSTAAGSVRARRAGAGLPSRRGESQINDHAMCDSD